MNITTYMILPEHHRWGFDYFGSNKCLYYILSIK